MALAVAAIVLLPLIAITFVAFNGLGKTEFAALTLLIPALFDTIILTTGVLGLSMIVGLGTGWLVASYRFPGRDILSWALVLPFAIPTYIAAYAAVEAMDYFGPLQSLLREIFGWKSRNDYWFPDVRSYAGAISITALVLYPYVYVASRAAFTMQGASLMDAARSLGCSRREALLKVVLPVTWPMLVAGGTLVLLETLGDIGASQYLGLNTLTVAIFNTWLSKGNLPGAAQIALLATACVFGLLWLERGLRNNPHYVMASRQYRPVSPPRLTGWRAIGAMLLAAMPVCFGFILPVGVLLRTALRQITSEGLSTEMLAALGNTLTVATLATVIILVLALLLAFARRFTRHRSGHVLVRISAIGYALPGTVLVIGLLPVLGLLDRLVNDLVIGLGGQRIGLLLSGSLLAIVLAYVIRFLAVGLEQAETGLASLSRNVDFAAQTLGAGEKPLAWSILTPPLRPVLSGAGVMVFVECLKELPATLLLRPLNFETLATQLYGHAARGSFEDGALAAVLIVASGLLPLIVMNRLMEQNARGQG